MPHPPTDECYEEHCLIHNEDEKVDENTFWCCYECFHVFQTKQDLIDAELKVLTEMSMLPHWGKEQLLKLPFKFQLLQQIPSCPHCTHDW